MGGTHSSNLMSDVKVLIVGSRNTDKFKFSVRNRSDVLFVRAESINEIHENWINNRDKADPTLVDINYFRLPIFQGLTVCVSRLTTDQWFSVEDKEYLITQLTENGAGVSDSLTGSTSCVLINEKSGKRYTMAKKWQIPNVHPRWVIDSLKRKAALDFQYYDIDLVSPERIGEGSCLVWDELQSKRKRRRVVADEEDQVKKKPEVWRSIMTDVKQHNALQSKSRDTTWDDGENLEHDEVEKVEEDKAHKPKKIKSFVQLAIESKLFAEKTFKVEFFEDDKMLLLKKTIQSHSGEVLNEDSDTEPDYLIIPSDFPTTAIPIHLKSSRHTHLVTEFFVERSLHYKTIKEDTWGEPFYQEISKGVQDMTISLTGFQGIELLHVSKMLQLSGIKLHDYLTKERDMLMVNYDILRPKSGEHLTAKYPTLFNKDFKLNVQQANIMSTKKKLSFAKANSIPIVTITYLFDSFFKGMLSNINNRECCVYCPKWDHLKEKLRPLTVMDTTRQQMTTGESKPPLPKSDSSLSLPKLPSPIRNKRHDNRSRLVGRAEVSNFKDNLHESVSNDPELQEDDTPKSTQIGYDDSEAGTNLLELLTGASKGKPMARDRAKEQAKPEVRSRTRQAYKEMLNILDND